MDNITMNDIIRKRRKELKLSQEEVADGICAVSTYSRVESGTTKNPDPYVVEGIFNRLKLYEYEYGDFYKTLEGEQERICKNILECLAKGQIDRVDEYIFAYKEIMNESAITERQFYYLAQMMWYMQNEIDLKDARTYFDQLLRITKPKVDIYGKIDYSEEKYSYQEQLIINNAALFDIETGNVLEANQMLAGLLEYVRGLRDESGVEYRKKAVVSNNLAISFAMLGQSNKALFCSDLSMEYMMKSGGQLYWGKVLRTRANILRLMKCDNTADKIDKLLECIFSLDCLPYVLDVSKDSDISSTLISVL
ncbi:MAG: helix-turn-helix transcriptional regulator [Pseudobutyrivibrio sp.]|nr:helix-turn-helix transcriptional regulator [Pseudobutyrivibrio sp.]